MVEAERLKQLVLYREPPQQFVRRLSLGALMNKAEALQMKLCYEVTEEGDEVYVLRPLPEVKPWPL